MAFYAFMLTITNSQYKHITNNPYITGQKSAKQPTPWKDRRSVLP